MELQINELMPLPLKDRLEERASDLWLKTITLQQGQKIFVQAPSGTGKTTLVHILYGLRNDYEGNIFWKNESLRNKNPEQLSLLRAKSISIIFQDLRLFPELTAFENLELKRSLTNTILQEEMLEWMKLLGIESKKKSLGKTLSYGEKQRVAIIRALLQPFSWLLMDEPFSHLDKGNIAKAANLINEVVNKNNAGFIMAELDENTYFDYTKTINL